MADTPSVAKLSLQLTGLFEAEVLVELMLRQWKHPLADQTEFRDQLLEQAADVLRFYRDYIVTAPEEVNGWFAFLTVPPGAPFPPARSPSGRG